MSEILDLIDEDNNVIGTAPRDEVHAKGLLHREVHVWFYTPDKKIIWQRRAPHKDFGNMLDATVGGHVASGQTYDEAALREVEEETGVKINPKDLEFSHIQNISAPYPHGSSSGNFSKQKVYFYNFRKALTELKVEAKSGAGFEAYSLEEMQTAIKNPKKADFIPLLLEIILPHFQKKLASD